LNICGVCMVNILLDLPFARRQGLAMLHLLFIFHLVHLVWRDVCAICMAHILLELPGAWR